MYYIYNRIVFSYDKRIYFVIYYNIYVCGKYVKIN